LQPHPPPWENAVSLIFCRSIGFIEVFFLRNSEAVTVAQVGEFDEVIDVRSESEFAEDHIPGALNCPVLNDAERARVGTIYKQVSSFEAKKIGAALVGRNIANHVETTFASRDRNWRPVIYCWRGGTRSSSLAEVLREIGWRADRLDGGYKTYRRAVIADLETGPAKFNWHVICGLTGSGKSRLLRAVQADGAQVLDLEALAAHRGSVLGNLPDEPQPSQKMFESLIWAQLRKFDPAKPVFVEAESKRIGRLRVPEAVIAAMWQADCIRVEASMALRVKLLHDEYQHFVADPALMSKQLDCLVSIYGQARISSWQAMAAARDGDTLVRELLELHYDPAYTRSTLKHYPRLSRAPIVTLTEASDAELEQLARRCMDMAK